MFGVFKSGMSAADDERSFFRNEIEYILEGKKSDAANRSAVRADLLKLRTLLNSIYIYSSPKMMNEALMLAETITPGAGGSYNAGGADCGVGCHGGGA